MYLSASLCVGGGDLPNVLVQSSQRGQQTYGTAAPRLLQATHRVLFHMGEESSRIRLRITEPGTQRDPELLKRIQVCARNPRNAPKTVNQWTRVER